ncbi:hypothetical protein FRX31_007754 [Thalictrum thalictroides]|uniref:Uncharacterized protein n=1 Tax=Thalictrum thalictroides TaxID=46969 RepID=A0A7J6WYY4_THATH|nr:hypothetical protein FRX31_007754 [Thalictrum thalictroides]
MEDTGIEDPDVVGGAVMCSLFPNDLDKIKNTSVEVILEELQLAMYRINAVGFGVGRRLKHFQSKNIDLRKDKTILQNEVGCLQTSLVFLLAPRRPRFSLRKGICSYWRQEMICNVQGKNCQYRRRLPGLRKQSGFGR